MTFPLYCPSFNQYQRRGGVRDSKLIERRGTPQPKPLQTKDKPPDPMCTSLRQELNFAHVNPCRG
eukprot:5530388-Amphidinium_carterae.1